MLAEATPVCAFSNPDAMEGAVFDWRTIGCRSVPERSGPQHITCQCDHLSHFAVLFDFSGELQKGVRVNFVTIRMYLYNALEMLINECKSIY